MSGLSPEQQEEIENLFTENQSIQTQDENKVETGRPDKNLQGQGDRGTPAPAGDNGGNATEGSGNKNDVGGKP